MDDKLYRLMNWPLIEGIIYAEENHPHDILGAHKIGKQLLFQAYFPDADAVNVLILDDEKVLKMTLADDDGFFAAIMPYKYVSSYQYEVIYKDETKKILEDPYRFSTTLTEEELHLFHAGIYETVYKKLGSHCMEIDGVKGCEFAVWAPGAASISVVGTFNDWNEKLHQMQSLGESGVFFIFIPDVKKGDLYKYRIKQKNGISALKSDPYAFKQEMRPDTASEVTAETNFKWHDDSWITDRLITHAKDKPFSVYEVYLASFMKPKEEKSFYNYRDYANTLVKYVVKMGYTHIELMPIMEYPDDNSLGYQTLGYYAPTSRYGDADDLKYFIDTMHSAGIGVILDWVPAYFPKDEHGLINFDGNSLYEPDDIKRRYYQTVGTVFFDFSKREVTNYLLSNAIYWIEEFHADGLRFVDLSSMLYLNYSASDQHEITNVYGNNMNLEAIAFIKHLNAVLKKRNPGIITIAEENTGWQGVTTSQRENGLGFDYKWNNSFKDSFFHYIEQDPFFRSHHHHEITDSLLYTYYDHFILPFSHNDVNHGPSIYARMPGKIDEKFANLRLTYAYMMFHPGRKLLFMGQELAEADAFNENGEIEWYLQSCKQNQGIQKCIIDLNMLYKSHPALYQLDDREEGFTWVDSMNNQNCCLTFFRNSAAIDKQHPAEKLLIVCNFANVMKITPIGVPLEGRYKEIFHTENELYGGNGFVNTRAKRTAAKSADGHPYSIKINMAPLSVCVFEYTAF